MPQWHWWNRIVRLAKREKLVGLRSKTEAEIWARFIFVEMLSIWLKLLSRSPFQVPKWLPDRTTTRTSSNTSSSATWASESRVCFTSSQKRNVSCGWRMAGWPRPYRFLLISLRWPGFESPARFVSSEKNILAAFELSVAVIAECNYQSFCPRLYGLAGARVPTGPGFDRR